MNLPDGYKCICSPGYRLHPSQAYCTGTLTGSPTRWLGWAGEGLEDSPESRKLKVQAGLCD